MTNCWSKGDLRAYCDGELGEPSAAEAEAHLRSCADCAAQYEEIRAKTSYVDGLIAELRETTSSPKRPANRQETRRQVPIRAAIFVGAIAAGLALFFVWPPPTQRQPEATLEVISRTSAATPVTARSAERPVLQSRRPRRAARKNLHVVINDDPIQAAYILRVALGPEEAPADVIVTPDGRIRAVRLLQQDQQ